MPATLEDMLCAAKFVGRMSADKDERADWARWLLTTADLLRKRRRRRRRADPLLGGGSLGDLCVALSPPGGSCFDSRNPSDLKALSTVAAVLAAQVDPL